VGAAILSASAYLKDTWLTSLKNSLRNGLKDVGKGWFNLNETKREVYDISKLKKFMTMINFMMQVRIPTRACLSHVHSSVAGAAGVLPSARVIACLDAPQFCSRFICEYFLPEVFLDATIRLYVHTC
jgi:hypothetical protein